MDNRETLPGYKCYLRESDGTRPPVYVAFLDLVPDDSATVNGVCLRVDRDMLRVLDARERNYERRDVTDRFASPLGRVWTYVGSESGRARLARGRERGSAVISREYVDKVRAGFERLGEGELERVAPLLGGDGLPIVALERIELDQAGRPVARGARAADVVS